MTWYTKFYKCTINVEYLTWIWKHCDEIMGDLNKPKSPFKLSQQVFQSTIIEQTSTGLWTPFFPLLHAAKAQGSIHMNAMHTCLI